MPVRRPTSTLECGPEPDQAPDSPQLDRRRFLGSAMVALAAAAVPRALGATGVTGASGAAGSAPVPASPGSPGVDAPARLNRVGVQLWTVRQDMAKDFEGTLARVAAIGYREVEFENYFGRSAAEVRRIVKAHGLTAPASHITYDRLRDEPEKVMDEAKAAGHDYVVFRWIEEKDRTPEGYARVIETLNRAGEVARRTGLVLAYHNHTFEFTPLPDGTRPYDLFLERTDPQLVRMEMDVYWLLEANLRPQDYFARWPGRFPLLHLKDKDAAGHMTDVGSGVLDWGAILGARRQAGVTHVFAEHDEPADPWASIANSYRYLSKIEFKDDRA